MIADGVLDRFPKPDIVLGQHLTPLPAGTIGVRPGTQMAASDGLTVRLLGRGGHGSRPHATIDPVVMAAATVMRLQTIVSREIDPREMAVVTVGSIHAGLKNNIIPAEAKLELSLRYPDDEARADGSHASNASCGRRPRHPSGGGAGHHDRPLAAADDQRPRGHRAPVRSVGTRLRRRDGRRPGHVHRKRGRLVVRPRGGRAARLLVLGRARPAAVRGCRRARHRERGHPHQPLALLRPDPAPRSSARGRAVVAAREFLG
jgi:hypothetical protein